jgi:hypothetical protein
MEATLGVAGGSPAAPFRGGPALRSNRRSEYLSIAAILGQLLLFVAVGRGFLAALAER